MLKQFRRLPDSSLRLAFVLATSYFAIGADSILAADTASLRVMSFNIRFGTAPDGANAWPLRKDLVFDTIREFAPDVLGVQEALRHQIDELTAALGDYASIGVGRDADGGGEYSAVFFRRSKFDVAESGTFWLSETPSVPGSATWKNELPRICTWARLLDRRDGKRFYFFNTHWDHQSPLARLNSGKLLAQRVADRAGRDEPAIVTGDFNAPESSEPIAALTSGDAHLRDAFRTLHPDATGVGTFHAFRGKAGEGKIDAVLATPGWEATSADVVRTSRDGRYPSDHFPVTAVLVRSNK